jgi:hypothetical protein
VTVKKTTGQENIETTWKNVTETKKDYFETFHGYDEKRTEGIILKKVEMNPKNTLNYRLTLLDINQENEDGEKETTEIIVNIDWKMG